MYVTGNSTLTLVLDVERIDELNILDGGEGQKTIVSCTSLRDRRDFGADATRIRRTSTN